MNFSSDRSWSLRLQTVLGVSRSVLLYIFCLSVILVTPARAIIDTNNNGLSDLWEKAYNQGFLFPNTFDPLADPDHDGWTNAQEAVAGTDPFNPNPPRGLIQPTLGHDAASFTITWPTLTGKQYTLLYSLDLHTTTWQTLMPPAIADGSNMSIVVPITLSTPDKLFWRVAVNDVYSNGGNISDYEAYQLLVDDGDNNGLFDTWEMTYFGHTGNDPYADPDGDGIINLLESEYQSNPFDYFNGQTPTVELLSGSGQRGAPDAILPSALAISVSNGYSNGFWNAPLQISITQGGALLSLDGTSGWSASVDTRTTATFTNDAGGSFLCAKVYIKLPSNTGDVSIITATAGFGTLTSSITAWAAVSDTSLPPPTELTVIPTSPSTVHLTWIPGDSSKATTIEFSTDGGNTWHTAAVAAAGVSQAIFNGLNPDQAIQFRVLTGGTPTASDGQNPPTFALPNGQIPPTTGTIVSPPSTPATATPVSAPTLLGAQTSASYYRCGFNGFLTPTNIYLNYQFHGTSIDEDDLGVGEQTNTAIYDDLKTGHITYSTTQTGQFQDIIGPWTTGSDTSRSREGAEDDNDGDTDTASVTENLSMEYTSAMFQTNVESWIPEYPTTFNPDVNTASISLTPEPAEAAMYYNLTKLKYKWRVNSIPGQVVNWMEVFTPADGSNPIVESKSWTPGASETESQTYEIDPSKKNEKKNGTYNVVTSEFEYFKPDTITDQQWQDSTQKMPWGNIYTFDAPLNQPLKFKYRLLGSKITPSLLSRIDIEITKHASDPNHGPTWIKYTLSDIGRISPDQSEVWCTISASDMTTKVKAPDKGASIRHASMDWIADPAISSFSDSNFFDVWWQTQTNSYPMVSARGEGNPTGNALPDPSSGEIVQAYTAKSNTDYLISGGAMYLALRMYSGTKETRSLCHETPNWLYLSVHGWHSLHHEIQNGVHVGDYPSGCIETVDSDGTGLQKYVSPENVNWHNGLDFVIIAGCSVLDINDYNNLYSGAEHSDSPGKRWAATGPSILLGYNAGGPSDKNGGNDIINAFLNNATNSTRIYVWLQAARDAKAWNACAIAPTDAYYYYDCIYVPGTNKKKVLSAEYTRIPKIDW